MRTEGMQRTRRGRRGGLRVKRKGRVGGREERRKKVRKEGGVNWACYV